MAKMHALTFASMVVVAISSMTSVSLGALSHILIVAPALYFFWNAEEKFREMSLSQWALVGIIDAILLSVFFNWGSMGDPFGAITKSKYFFLTFLGLYAYRSTFTHYMTPKRIRLLVTLFVLATTVATVSGLIGLWTGFNPVRFKEACHETRACGVFGMYMTYGYGMSLACLIMVGLILYRNRLQEYLVSLPFLYVCTAINFAGLYLSYARGAWIGFALAFPFFFFKDHKKAFLGTVAGVALLSGLLVQFSPQVRETFFSENRLLSNSIRISMYQAAYAAFRESPIVGIGFREFEANSERLKLENDLPYAEFKSHAHNNFLEHLATTGILGFLAVVAFHLFWLWEMYRRDDVVARITFPFVISFIISGMVQYNFGDAENLFMVMLVYALSQIGMPRREVQA